MQTAVMTSLVATLALDDVAIRKKCAAGLVRKPNPKAPVSEHTPGICKKP